MQITHTPNAEAKSMYQIWCGIITIVVVMAILFSILPFYVFGLHQQPTNLVIGGHFDPKMMEFYETPIGKVIYVAGIILFIGTPVAFAIFLPLIVITMARSWRLLSRNWRVYGVLLLAICGALALFMYVGAGRLILTWFMD
jgi:hypothetical protein